MGILNLYILNKKKKKKHNTVVGKQGNKYAEPNENGK